MTAAWNILDLRGGYLILFGTEHEHSNERTPSSSLALFYLAMLTHWYFALWVDWINMHVKKLLSAFIWETETSNQQI